MKRKDVLNLIDKRIKEHKSTMRWLIEQTEDNDLSSGIPRGYIGAINELEYMKRIIKAKDENNSRVRYI